MVRNVCLQIAKSGLRVLHQIVRVKGDLGLARLAEFEQEKQKFLNRLNREAGEAQRNYLSHSWDNFFVPTKYCTFIVPFINIFRPGNAFLGHYRGSQIQNFPPCGCVAILI